MFGSQYTALSLLLVFISSASGRKTRFLSLVCPAFSFAHLFRNNIASTITFLPIAFHPSIILKPPLAYTQQNTRVPIGRNSLPSFPERNVQPPPEKKCF